MDLCSFCCTDEADLGVAPYDRIAAHIGLSDDDLLDFESDSADAPSLARAAKRNKSQNRKLKSRVSSEVYRLEESLRRSREQQELLRHHKQQQQQQQQQGVPRRHSSSLSRSFGSNSSNSSKRNSTESAPAAAAEPAEAAATAAAKHSKRAPSSSSIASSSKLTQQRSSSPPAPAAAAATAAEPLPQRLPSARHKQQQQQQQNAAAQQQENGEAKSQEMRRPSGIRRLSDMSEAEKAKEKKRLQALVKEFAKEAVAGFEVTLVDIYKEKTSTAVFSMDRHLLNIAVTSAESPFPEFPVADIRGILKAEDFFKKEKKEKEKSFFENFDKGLVLVLKSHEEMLLEFPEKADRDRAYASLKILRLSVDLGKK